MLLPIPKVLLPPLSAVLKRVGGWDEVALVAEFEELPDDVVVVVVVVVVAGL